MTDPVFVSIAAALAGKSVTSLYELVRRKFGGKGDAAAALEGVPGASPDSAEVADLAAHLTAAEAGDPAFGLELRHLWQQVAATRDGVVNQITGNVSGKVVQARDIKGGVRF
ncbi:MAG: hypothetical protein WBA97_38410 [Actinophytocola sp.]|uniref:hypothetical protein n=1 Tax=Actinophytocola sp. TaxID=1872138 RepID=UPI003C71C569